MVLISDLVEAVPLQENPYTELPYCLLVANQLTDIQQVEQLFNLPPLVSQKPSELLIKVLHLCPRGQENNALFHRLFLNKLPRDLCVLLAVLIMADKQALDARAVSFADHNSKLSHMVSDVEQARMGSGFCFSHLFFGTKARRWEAPCNWTGS